jgi:hydroxyacylglutathione hydrolase
MFIETIRSPGLAHLSYIIGDNGEAAVVDPRRDIEIYIETAQRNGAEIKYVFETHRNEDYVVGSCDLARRTGAKVLHGHALDFGYGQAVRQDDSFMLGKLKLRVLETPGHTFESISIALYDTDFSKTEAVAVFTGDTLFIGDVGRADFYPERAQEVANLLYDSLFETLLPLGDQVILYPAHGAGSVCGAGMADREFSTIGYERRNNPMLQISDRESFVEAKLREKHAKPPYFAKMEELNQQGQAPLEILPRPRPISAKGFAEALQAGIHAVDLRSPEAIAGAFVPGSLALPLPLLSGFAGWFLPYDQPIGLIADDFADVEEAVRQLVRIGYEQIECFLDNGLHGWEVTGHHFQTVPAIHAELLKTRLEQNSDFTLLDVRSDDEVESGILPGAHHIYLGQLPDQLEGLPRGRTITTFCGSGQRAIVAASLLKQAGFEAVEVCLGSMAACRAIGCELVTPQQAAA